MPIDPILLLGAVATLLSGIGLKEIVLALISWGQSRAAKRAEIETTKEGTALTREDKLAARVAILEGQMALQAQQLLDSERVRARQEAQLADVCAERDGWRAQFHDLAVVVQREEEPVSGRILARYQAMQIARSAPTPPVEATGRLDPRRVDPPQGAAP